MAKRRCYIYTRVSTAAQVDGYSLEAQAMRLHDYASLKNLEIAGEYCDAGKSGGSIRGRPEFQHMLDDITSLKDEISLVLVFKLSRFGRNAADVLNSLQYIKEYYEILDRKAEKAYSKREIYLEGIFRPKS